METDLDQVKPEEEILVFQETLDRWFPIGALCVEFVEDDGRLRTTGTEIVTGRVLCTGAARDKSGRWRHRVLIDPRRRANGNSDPYEAWIATFRRHHEIADLWEASVVSDGEPSRVLRLLADPEPPWRPTPSMRRAVTKAHSAAA